jgi:4-amino-4-deoxy-L-arabinose transferase-like glycosyltransferase
MKLETCKGAMTVLSREAVPVEKPYEFWLIAVLLVLLALRLTANAFAVTDLVFNEAQYWSWSRELDLGYFSKPPLLAWLIRGTSELCGQGEACLRSFPPVLFTLATWFVFLTGRALYGTHAGFWSGIIFATLPLTAFLATAITTDVPLLLFWCIALYLWTMLIERKSMVWAIPLGLTIGVGLLAKYAMIYFPLGMAIQAMFSAEARKALRESRGLVIMLAALVLIAPNLYWNYTHGFVSFRQTATSAGWGHHFAHPATFVRFLLSQFLVYGPVLSFMLLWIVAVTMRGRIDRRVVMLLSFSLPVIVLITVQSFISRTHAYWTASASPAASILVTAWLLERQRKVLFGTTVAINALATAAMLVGPTLPPSVFPARSDPFARMRGWHDVAAAVRMQLATNNYDALAVDSRELAAELLYYLRDSRVPLFAIASRDEPANTFEMTRPYGAGAPEPVLFVSLRPQSRGALNQFKSVTSLASETIPGGRPEGRTLRFYRLSGFTGR